MAQLLFFGTAGPENPTKATLPFFIGKAAKESGIDVALVLGGEAPLLMKGAIRDNVQGVGLPPLKDLFAFARSAGIPLYV
ncbi:MAG TPA: hypothetical protein VNM66_02660 [Thermodesulfobacteriota bacterium]|nr:hypothetical protein [Thermodesulfobacteriota bacterium]